MKPCSSSLLFLYVGLLLLVTLTHGEDAGSRNKYINVGVVSSWDATPFHMEASEFIAEESESLFWKFITAKFGSGELTPETLYKKSVEAAENLLANDKVQLLKLALSLRTYSPKIEMYRQLPKMENDITTVIHARIGSTVISTASELESAIAKFSAGSTSAANLFQSDHIYPTGHNHTHHVVLYADFADPAFSPLHSILSSAAEKGKIGYVLRHLVPASSAKVNLQGWGVDLAIKNVEYKAMDDSKVAKEGGEEEAAVSGVDEEEDIAGFRLAVLKQRKPHLVQQLDDFGTFLMRQDVKVDELNVWDFRDMGLQASQKIVTGSDPLRALRDISQNFPSLAGSLTRLKQNQTLKQDISANQRRVNEGENIVLLNGRVIDPENLDAFDFIKVLKEEISKVEALQRLKMDLQTILPFVSNPLPEKADLRFKIDSERTIFYNNLETDETYGRWPRSVTDFLRRVYPGQMRFVAKNFFTVVLVSDFTTDQGLDAVGTLFSLLNQNLPARVGILPLANKDQSGSEELAKILVYISEKHGSKPVFRFLNQFNQRVPRPITSEGVRTTFSLIAPNFGIDSYDTIMASEEANAHQAEVANMLTTLGLDSHHMFINGFLADGNKEVLDSISEAMFDQTPFLQGLVNQGRINDGTNIYQFLMNPPDFMARAINVVKRFNKFVPPSDAYPLQYVNLIGAGTGAKLEGWETLSVPEKTSKTISRLSFLEANKDDVKKFSHILIVDIHKEQNVELALEAIKFIESSQNSRVALLFNPESAPSTATESSTHYAVEEAIIKAATNMGVVRALLESQLTSLNLNTVLSKEAIAKVVDEARKGKKLPQTAVDPREVLVQGRWWVANVAGVTAGSSAVLVNGRKIQIPTVLQALDFEFMETYQDLRHSKSIELLLREPRFDGVDSDDLTSSFLSTVVMQAISQLGLDEQNSIKRRALASDLKVSAEQSTSENPTLHVTAVLNPLSKASQKFSPVLLTLRKLLSVKIQLYLNPVLQLSDLPLKRYYHYVFNADIEFDENGQLASSNTATLSQLPLSRILTLGMDVPEAWLVQPIVARYDLDNIKLEDLGDEKVLTAIFELEYILVEGNCYDLSTLQWGMPSPPRGLELVLQHNDPKMPSVDTLVMSNFGYFQLKANPGIWKLKLAEGRGTMIFSIAKDGTQQEGDQPDFKWVVVSSFLGESVTLRVERKPGMETTQLLLAEEEEPANAWDALAGLWKGGKKEDIGAQTLHIFSVASGHLYERLTRIMMLSVIKQTKNPVKFWFLKNYMSPKFKEIIPNMAEQYNFTYELVTYKWPSWLRKQTEKQRIIWAYKILFLDVLFPLGVKKIIFVDADQVVRTDMMELYNMDLEGAPLAYTPFCNNKPEMDGFRFWKAGYWKDHLRGKPYHISALYVIDLQQFRRTAAGDQLRSTYDMLSRDPNSLANLDQDLPNYLQHQVKIHSLPQEWLWCETWCPEETKTTAKTIDLCNNPLTKASKLENAVRILGDEWIDLDNEVKDLETKISQNKTPPPSSSSTPSSSTSSSHPHSSHVTHENVPVEKIKQAFGQL